MAYLDRPAQCFMRVIKRGLERLAPIEYAHAAGDGGFVRAAAEFDVHIGGAEVKGKAVSVLVDTLFGVKGCGVDDLYIRYVVARAGVDRDLGALALA